MTNLNVPASEWADVRQLETTDPALGGPGGVMNAQAVALMKRDNHLLGLIETVQAAQQSGLIGFATKAEMDADLAHPEGALAMVTNDPTVANNGSYRKVGATGAGSWEVSADRVSVVESRVSTVETEHDSLAASAAGTASGLAAHQGRSDNPHGVTKAQIGLGSADDTSDASKPVSGPQQSALDQKAGLAELAGGSGSEMVGFQQAAAGAVQRTMQGKGREWLSPEDFGAIGDGVADDKAKFDLAIAALPVNGVLRLAPGKTYRLASEVPVAKRITVVGNGAKIVIGANRALNISAPVRVYGVEFDSTATGSTIAPAIYGAVNGLGGTLIEQCRFGRVSVNVWDAVALDTTAGNGSVRILNNTFSGDYAGGVGGDTTNIIDVRGASDVHIEGNDFNVIGVERFGKVSGGCRRVLIRGNTLKCGATTIGKQAFDLFTDTREVIVANNVADLTGFTAFVENKSGSAADAAEPSEIIVSDNVIKMAGAIAAMTPIGVFGSWGLAHGTLVRSTCAVHGNSVLLDTTGATSASILVRGMTHAKVSGNTLWRNDTPNFASSIEVSNCKRIAVKGNTIEYGVIFIGLARNNPGAFAYTLPPDDVQIHDNMVASFGSQSGVLVVGAGTIARVSIHGNDLVALAGAGSSGVINLDTVAVSSLSVVGNMGASLTNADVVLINAATVAKWNMTGNSWQAAGVSANPGTIADGSVFNINIVVKGAAPGDVVSVGLPYDMQGASVQARVNGGSNVNILIRNRTGGPLTFGAGTFSAATART